jgi:hypothetical protein
MGSLISLLFGVQSTLVIIASPNLLHRSFMLRVGSATANLVCLDDSLWPWHPRITSSRIRHSIHLWRTGTKSKSNKLLAERMLRGAVHCNGSLLVRSKNDKVIQCSNSFARRLPHFAHPCLGSNSWLKYCLNVSCGAAVAGPMHILPQVQYRGSFTFRFLDSTHTLHGTLPIIYLAMSLNSSLAGLPSLLIERQLGRMVYDVSD